MSSEERQRIIREQGSRPAETEKQESAKESREAFNREQARDRGGPADPGGETPAAEDDPDRPVPRR